MPCLREQIKQDWTHANEMLKLSDMGGYTGVHYIILSGFINIVMRSTTKTGGRTDH